MARIHGGNQIISTGTTGVTSKTVTFPVAIPAGSLIVVAGHIWRATDPTGIVITDSVSTSYTTQETASQSWSSGVSRGFIARGIIGAAGTPVVTCTSGGSTSFITFGAIEVPEVNATPLDVDGGESTATSTTASDGITTVANNAVIFALLAIGAGGADKTITSAAGTTNVFRVVSAANAPWALGWKRLPTAGATTLSWTVDNIPWIVRTISFKG